MKTLEAITKLGGFNQRLPVLHSNKRFPYIGLLRNEYDAIDTLFLSLPPHDGTTSVELSAPRHKVLMSL